MEKIIDKDEVIRRIAEALRYNTDGHTVAEIYNRLMSGPKIIYHYASVEHGDHVFTVKN